MSTVQSYKIWLLVLAVIFIIAGVAIMTYGQFVHANDIGLAVLLLGILFLVVWAIVLLWVYVKSHS